MSTQRASAREAIATIGHALAGQSRPVMFVGASATGIGPTNRWYRDAFAEAAVHSLESAIEVRAITPLYFVATKLEAFRGRGGGDYQASHDLEDILTVLSGLARLREQIVAEGTTVATFVRSGLFELAAKEAFIDAVPAHFEGDLIGQARADLVLAWLSSLRGE
jgi:hypothetical protein